MSCIAAADEGWKSGYVSLPWECAGTTVRACARYLHSQDPTTCLKCAAQPAFQHSMLDGALSGSFSKADGCASCYNLERPLVCLACLATNAPCAECALQQPDAYATPNLAACINCTMKHGEKLKSTCMLCANLGADLDQVDKCMRCVSTIKPLACDNPDSNGGCWNPAYPSYACVACASRAQDYDTCMACMQQSPYSVACELCAGLDSCKQAQCYQCSNAAAHSRPGCSACLKYIEGSAQQQQCLALTRASSGAVAA